MFQKGAFSQHPAPTPSVELNNMTDEALVAALPFPAYTCGDSGLPVTFNSATVNLCKDLTAMDAGGNTERIFQGLTDSRSGLVDILQVTTRTRQPQSNVPVTLFCESGRPCFVRAFVSPLRTATATATVSEDSSVLVCLIPAEPNSASPTEQPMNSLSGLDVLAQGYAEAVRGLLNLVLNRSNDEISRDKLVLAIELMDKLLGEDVKPSQ